MPQARSVDAVFPRLLHQDQLAAQGMGLDQLTAPQCVGMAVAWL